jgi:WD40-like Beta Propeller Repeat
MIAQMPIWGILGLDFLVADNLSTGYTETMRLLCVISVLFSATLPAQTTERLSVNSSGIEANAWSQNPSISADGRFVAFENGADNLVPGDTNGASDVFVHDRLTNLTTMVSVNSAGIPGDWSSIRPVISADGRFVAFQSFASNFVPGDTSHGNHVYVHDRQTGETTRVSVNSSGVKGGTDSFWPSISADGRFVAFGSWANNLVPGDTNKRDDVFVHDRQTGETTRVSVDSAGVQGNEFSYHPSISADGRFVAFESKATNLVLGDGNRKIDVFLHDRQMGITTRVSITSSGSQGNSASFRPSISADGGFIAFESWADNFVPGDTNGRDVFVHNRKTGETTRVSVSSAGRQANRASSRSTISADGRFVGFMSQATNLVPGDTNGQRDVFLHDRQTGVTARVSLDSAGTQGNQQSNYPFLSADGRSLVFISRADNLVPGDRNGTDDVFVRDQGVGTNINSIILSGPFEAPVGFSTQLSWTAAPPNSPYWLAFSLRLNGSIISGHPFDLGLPVTFVSVGTTSSTGNGTFLSPPIPIGAMGNTLFFEMGVRISGGRLFDSIVQPITFF